MHAVPAVDHILTLPQSLAIGIMLAIIILLVVNDPDR